MTSLADTEHQQKETIQIKEKIRDALLMYTDNLRTYAQCSGDRKKISKLKRQINQIDVRKPLVSSGDRDLSRMLDCSGHDVLLQVISDKDCHSIHGLDLYGNRFLPSFVPPPLSVKDVYNMHNYTPPEPEPEPEPEP